MELPIQVMIVLFVAILVASAVIIFATDIINDAKVKINDPWKKDKNVAEDKIIEIESLNDEKAQFLIEDCFSKNKQDAMVKTLCYIVHAKTTYDASNIPESINDITVDKAGVSESSKTLYIYYNPAGNKIELSN